MIKNILAASVACTSLLFSAQAFATPTVSGEISFEVQNDWTYEADTATDEVRTLFATIEPYITMTFNKKVSLIASLILEPTQDPDAGDDTNFDNQGLFVEELKLVYTGENFSVFGGKFNPSFGKAWDITPGIYGDELNGDYELTERLGAGMSYSFDGFGQHTFTANSFFLDTTFLSESFITKRGRTQSGDGGISNTNSPSSFTFTLDTESFGGVEGLNTNIGYSNQADGDADTGLDREKGYVVGADYSFGIAEKTTATLIGEWAKIVNESGSDDHFTYLTASTGITWHDKWNTAISFEKRSKDVNAGADLNDHMTQLAAGYSFDNGFSVDAAYKLSEESGADKKTVGILLGYAYTF